MTSFGGAVEDFLYAIIDVVGGYMVDERGREEEGDDGADVENEEHPVESECDQPPFHRQTLLGVTGLQLHHERLEDTLDLLHLQQSQQ